MKKTNLRKLTSFVLAAVMCLTTALVLPVTAAVPSDSDSGIAQPFNIAVTLTSNSLTIYNSSTKTLQCSSSTSVLLNYKARITMELQKYTSSGWKTQTTWTATGGTIAALEKYPSVSSGEYRLQLTHEALNSTGTSVIETITKYSVSVTVP